MWDCYLKDVDEIDSDSELGKEEQYIMNCLNVMLANLKTNAHVQTHANYTIYKPVLLQLNLNWHTWRAGASSAAYFLLNSVLKNVSTH